MSGTTTNYFYSGSVVISEKQGSAWTDYIFFGGIRVAQQSGSNLTLAKFLHADHLGSTRACSDGAGNPLGSCDYEPFGEFQPGAACSNLPTNYRFAGMQWDADAGPNGLYHTWFRYYDVNQGRWMGVDPLSGSPDNPQSADRYNYVLDDPANLVDPLGLFDCPAACIRRDINGDPHCDCPLGNAKGGGWSTLSSTDSKNSNTCNPNLRSDPRAKTGDCKDTPADDKEKKLKEVLEKIKKNDQEIQDCIAEVAKKRDQRIKRDRGVQLVGGLLTLAGVAILRTNAVNPGAPPLVSAGMFTELAITHGHGIGAFAYLGYYGPLVGGGAAFLAASFDIGYAWNDYYKDVERCIASIPFPSN